VEEGDRESAVAGLTRALALPEAWWIEETILLCRAGTRAGVDDLEGAIRDARRVLDRFPESERAIFICGTCYEIQAGYAFVRGEDGMGHILEARTLFDRVLAKYPSSPWALLGRTEIHLLVGIYKTMRGGDPRPEYRKGLEDAAKGILQDFSMRDRFLMARAQVSGALGEAMGKRREDPHVHLTQAESDFSDLIARHGDVAKYRYERGMLYRKWGQFEAATGGDPALRFRKAIGDVSTALVLGQKRSSSAKTVLAGIHLDLVNALSRSGVGIGPPARAAEGLCSEVLEEDPENHRAYRIRAEVRVNLSETVSHDVEKERILAGALRDVDEAIRRVPTSVAYLLVRSQVCAGLLQVGEAQGKDPDPVLDIMFRDFTEALRLQPDDFHTLRRRGTTHSRAAEYAAKRGRDPSDHHKACVRDLTAALRRSPGDEPSRRIRGHAALRVGTDPGLTVEERRKHLRLVQEDYRRLIRRDPADAMALQGLAWARLELSRLGEGKEDVLDREGLRKVIDDLTQVLEGNRREIRALIPRGTARCRVAMMMRRAGEDPWKEFEHSLDDFDEAYRRSRRKADIFLPRGITSLKMGIAREEEGENGLADFRNALEDFREAVRRKPSSWEAHRGMGRVLDRLDRLPEAEKALETAARCLKEEHAGLARDLERVRAKRESKEKRKGR
jgi:tetratricopeptide (TPR) repeat protein